MEYLAIILLYLFVINIVTTIRLLKSNEHEVFQKAIQVLLIWLLPIVGILLVSHFLNDNPIIIKDNLTIYFIIKILLFPFLIKVIKVPKEHYNDISSSNNIPIDDVSGYSGGSFSSGGD